MCIIMSLDVNEMELKGLKLKTCDLPEKRQKIRAVKRHRAILIALKTYFFLCSICQNMY